MKASPLPAAIACAALLVWAAAPRAAAADSVVRKSGQTLEGQVVGTAGGNLRIKVGEATISVPLADVDKLRMQPPAEFTAAAGQLSRGDSKAALAALEKINQTYAGLPAPWAERAAAMLGDAKLATGDKEGAKAAYEQFTKTYPASVALANIGMARLALESGDTAGAAKLLGAFEAQSAKTAFPADGDGPALSQAFFLLGRVKEAQGDNAAALQNYLKASALFPFDQNAVADARKRADALRADNPALIVP
jgi:tetratricopeptide (TPR) repeat protein